LAAPPSPQPTQQSPEAALAETERCLRALPNLNIEAGMKLSRGKWPFYLRLLGLFVHEHANQVARMRAAIGDEQPEEVRRLAHSLKGSAGNIGAINVQALSAAVELPFKQGLPNAEEVAAGDLDALENELATLVASLQSALAAQPGADNGNAGA
jgi:two-component system, sensor histidine kinase and response regulator